MARAVKRTPTMYRQWYRALLCCRDLCRYCRGEVELERHGKIRHHTFLMSIPFCPRTPSPDRECRTPVSYVQRARHVIGGPDCPIRFGTGDTLRLDILVWLIRQSILWWTSWSVSTLSLPPQRGRLFELPQRPHATCWDYDTELKLTAEPPTKSCTPSSCWQSARPCSKVVLERTTKESTALAPSTARSTWLFRFGMDWRICFVFPQLSAVLTSQDEYDVPCPERPQFAYCESILAKGYESILWMVFRPAFLNSAEMDTLTKSCSPTMVITANGEVQTYEEATVRVKELDIFLTMKVLEDYASSFIARKALRWTRILLWVDQRSKTTSH